MRPVETLQKPQGTTRPGVFRAFAIAAHLIAILVLVQAILAGRGQFVDRSFIDMHEMTGNLVWLLALAQLILVFVAGIGGAMKRMLTGTSALLFILITLQIGLGYAGRSNTEMAALHVPTGVLIFGLAVYHLVLIARQRRA